MSFFSESKTCY